MGNGWIDCVRDIHTNSCRDFKHIKLRLQYTYTYVLYMTTQCVNR